MALADHLRELYDTPPLAKEAWDERMARAIASDPQAHIDALVEAGVLRSFHAIGRDGGWLHDDGTTAPPGTTAYTVVPPHKHEWRVTSTALIVDYIHATGETEPGVLLSCGGCLKTAVVPNRLPLEVPE